MVVIINCYYYHRQQARSDLIVWSSGDYYGGDHLNDLMMLIIFCNDTEGMDYDDFDDHADQHYDDYDDISQRRSLQRTVMCKTPSSSLSSSKPGL